MISMEVSHKKVWNPFQSLWMSPCQNKKYARMLCHQQVFGADYRFAHSGIEQQTSLGWCANPQSIVLPLLFFSKKLKEKQRKHEIRRSPNENRSPEPCFGLPEVEVENRRSACWHHGRDTFWYPFMEGKTGGQKQSSGGQFMESPLI